MTPEERERMMERMRARGFTTSAEGLTPLAQQTGGRGQGARSQTAARQTQPPPSAAGATTFDALFAPLVPTESVGQAWLNAGGQLQRVRMRLGITDGQQTELLQTLEGNVQEGSELVTNVLIGAVRQTANPPAGGAAFPGLGRQGGFGGGRGRGR